MSLGNDFEGVLHDLPTGWLSASVKVTYEREPRELGGNEVASRSSTMEMLSSFGARSTPDGGLRVDVTPATGPSVHSLLRQLEGSGRRGQVELVAVTVADAYAFQCWDPPENLRRGQRVGATLRAA
jgi:hypothetical protein